MEQQMNRIQHQEQKKYRNLGELRMEKETEKKMR